MVSDILVDILTFINANEVTPEHEIVHYFSNTEIAQHIVELQDAGFIRQIKPGRKIIFYAITDTGRGLICNDIGNVG